MSNDTISRQAAIDALGEKPSGDTDWDQGCRSQWEWDTEILRTLQPMQSELEKKILEIGYTGKEGRIYIGGRLFAVRELAQ